MILFLAKAWLVFVVLAILGFVGYGLVRISIAHPYFIIVGLSFVATLAAICVVDKEF